jgi:hypothetical protein
VREVDDMNANYRSLRKLALSALTAVVAAVLLIGPSFVKQSQISLAQDGSGEERPVRKRSSKRKNRPPRSTATVANSKRANSNRPNRATANSNQTANQITNPASTPRNFYKPGLDQASSIPSPLPTSTPQVTASDALLLPKDFLELESKRENWERQQALKAYSSTLTLEQPDWPAQPKPSRDPWQTPPPWFATPTPMIYPPIDAEKYAKVFGRPPPRTLATPVPIVREPVARVPVYIPDPTPRPLERPIFVDPAPSIDSTDNVLIRLLHLSEQNPHPRINTKGQISEMLGKTKVFVNATGLAADRITARLREYGRPEIVLTAAEAEFAVNYFTRIDGSKGGALIVTIRDPNERLPRILWRDDLKNSDAFDKLVKRFIKELRKLRGDK